MGIEGGSSNNEVQSQEISQSGSEQFDQNAAEHQENGEELEGNSTIDNEGERKQIEGKDEDSESVDNESSSLDNDDKIEDDSESSQTNETEGSKPDQQFDKQDTLEADQSSSDEMSDVTEEPQDSLDSDDMIESDKDETEKTSEVDEGNDTGDENALDSDDSLESDNTDDEAENPEVDTEDTDSLDEEDSVEDDSEKTEDDADEPEESEETEDESEETEDDAEKADESEETEEESEDTEDDVEEPDESEEENEEESEDTEDEEDKTDESEEETEDTEDEEDNPDESEEETEDTEDEEDKPDEPEDESEDTEDEEDNPDEPEDESEETENEEDKPDESEETDGDERPSDFESKEAGLYDIDDDTQSGEVSDELKESLESFEQSNWDGMSLEQKKDAVTYLRDSVADELGLQDKPNVEYYNNNDDGDYGGYSPSKNTIYINEHNIGDAKETADTIAHESRHCWQHEIAENSDSPQAQEFRENFADYIRPEDDYRGYRDQPVEADARDYARSITDNIPEHGSESSNDGPVEETNSNPASSEIRQNEAGNGAAFESKASLPEDIENKSEGFESKVKGVEDYASKCEHDTQQKLEDYYKSGDGKLTDEQKSQLVSELKASYDSADKSERGNVLVPENLKDVSCVYFNEKTGKYDVGYNWKPVDTVPESRKMEVLSAGQQFDRIGSPSGRCTGAVGEDGSCATLKERSVPYHCTETDITKEPSYHRYEAEQDFTKENLSNAIENSMYSDEKKAQMHADLDRYYENAQKKGYGDGDGLATGTIAPMFEDTTGATGGGKQHDMPFSMEELEDTGMISEVPKDSY